MQDTGIPTKIGTIWGASAIAPYINTIPIPSQQGITNGRASFTDGFPPNCFIPIGSGGAGPFGSDINGILQLFSQWLQWNQAGGPITYDSAFSTAIGGYPAGAIIASPTLGRIWQSTVDNNTSDPETGGANWTLLIGNRSWSANTPPSDVLLQPNEKALITFTSLGSIPLSVAVPSGNATYSITIITQSTNTTNADIHFQPNNKTYSAAFSCWQIEDTDQQLSGTGSGTSPAPFSVITSFTSFPGEMGNVPISGYGPGNAVQNDFAFDLFFGPSNSNNDVGPWVLDIIASTPTAAKMVKGHGAIKGGPSIHALFWNDTLTPWTSLGTIVDANSTSMSGYIVVERLS